MYERVLRSDGFFYDHFYLGRSANTVSENKNRNLKCTGVDNVRNGSLGDYRC